MINAIKYLILLSICFTIYSCADTSENISDTDVFDTSDWTEETHGNSIAPNYSVVFNQEEVIRFDIKISSENWQRMLDDMTNKHGSFGAGGRSMGGSSVEDPIFVPCSFNFNGLEWYQVGVRFKGNSSLASSWSSGNWKLPFKFDFDEFEDTYPEINNQRFYGFKKLSLSNGFGDNSLIREKVAADIFRAAGIKSAHTSFCRLYIDYGEGSKYFGLYTIVEVVDDTVLEEQFGSDDGNCYKPDGTGASFQYGTFNESDFVKKTNEEEADWSDVNSLYEVLHQSERFSDPASWRNDLEGVLDVNQFLKWLAVNTTIQNWDTYGKMTHNYYLYNDPNDNLLKWIPWDNNESLMNGKQGGALSISLNEVDDKWPLIRFLLDDDSYKDIYKTHLQSFIDNVFNVQNMSAKYDECHNLISQYVTGTDGEVSGYTQLTNISDFNASANSLISHANARISAVNSYLSD